MIIIPFLIAIGLLAIGIINKNKILIIISILLFIVSILFFISIIIFFGGGKYSG